MIIIMLMIRTIKVSITIITRMISVTMLYYLIITARIITSMTITVTKAIRGIITEQVIIMITPYHYVYHYYY